MTDPTKKNDSDKAKAVKNAMTGTPDADSKSMPTGKPAEPVKESPKPDAQASAAAKPASTATAKPPESVKEPTKQAAVPPAGVKAPTSEKEPARGSVPASSPSTGKPGVTSGSKEPPRSPGGPQGPGAPKGPGTPPSSAAPKSPPPKKPAAAPKKKGGCLGTLIWLVVILGALGAAAYYTWPYWPDVVKKPVEAKIAEVVPEIQTPEEKAAIEDRLAKNEEQLSALESKVAELSGRKTLTADEVKALVESSGGAGADDAQVSALTARLDAIEKSLASVGKSTSATAGASVAGTTAAIGASVQSLSERVKKLENDVATASSVESRVTDIEEHVLATPSGEAKTAVVLAVSHLDHAVLRSVPFSKELDALKAIANDDASLAEPISTLEPMADTGVPSLIALRASFSDVATEVSRMHADLTGEDWVDKALSRVTSLVSVRKTGADAMAAEGTDGAVAQADAALILGDLDASVKAMKRLEGPAAEAAAPWLAQAQKRLDAMAALAALRQGAIALLAKGG